MLETMKTPGEIETEARQLLVLGRQFENDRLLATDLTNSAGDVRVVATLAGNPAGAQRPLQIGAAFDRGELVFRLMMPIHDREEEQGTGNGGGFTVLAASSSAAEVLRTGYELMEERDLVAALHIELERWDESRAGTNLPPAESVEGLLEPSELSAADRLRTKAEVADFFAGRLERSVLISRHLERLSFSDAYGRQLLQRHEFKLTIGEP